MGRRKVEIKLIENKSSRQVTFSKRRNGLIEKARQLSILCESSVAVLVVSATGKLYNSSSGNNMTKIIDRYEVQHADELRTLDLAEETRNYLPHKELLELVKSNLEEANVDNGSVDSLSSLEEQLETALSVTRARKTELTMEFVETLQEKEKLLREENLVLASQMANTTFLVTEGERAMSPANSSGINPPETLPLLNMAKILKRYEIQHADERKNLMKKKRFPETEDEGEMSSEDSSGNSPPETLSLLK